MVSGVLLVLEGNKFEVSEDIIHLWHSLYSIAQVMQSTVPVPDHVCSFQHCTNRDLWAIPPLICDKFLC